MRITGPWASSLDLLPLYGGDNTHGAEVVAVSAGMSGIAAAWSLRQAGITSILLEARGRIVSVGFRRPAVRVRVG